MSVTNEAKIRERLYNFAFVEWDGAVAVAAPDTRVLSWTKGAAELFGHTFEEACAKTLESMVPASGRAVFRELLEAARASGIMRNAELVMLNKGGFEVKVFATIYPLADEGGRPLCSVIWLRPEDKVSVKGLEDPGLRETVLRMQQLSAVGQLTAALAHQIRTPLHVIQSTVELMQDQFDPGSAHLESLRVMDRNVGRIRALSDALAGFTHYKQHELVRGDLNKIVEQVCVFMEMVCKKQNVRLTRALAPVGKVLLDGDYLVGALYNVMANAVEAMHGGGVLTVTTAQREREVTLTIADTGAGIDPALMDQIGRPFFTTKAAGTGLGLYVVKQILEQHKADFRIESRRGAGTKITIVFREA